MTLVFAFCSIPELFTWPVVGVFAVVLLSTLASVFYFDLKFCPIVALVRRDVSVA